MKTRVRLYYKNNKKPEKINLSEKEEEKINSEIINLFKMEGVNLFEKKEKKLPKKLDKSILENKNFLNTQNYILGKKEKNLVLNNLFIFLLQKNNIFFKSFNFLSRSILFLLGLFIFFWIILFPLEMFFVIIWLNYIFFALYVLFIAKNEIEPFEENIVSNSFHRIIKKIDYSVFYVELIFVFSIIISLKYNINFFSFFILELLIIKFLINILNKISWLKKIRLDFFEITKKIFWVLILSFIFKSKLLFFKKYKNYLIYKKYIVSFDKNFFIIRDKDIFDSYSYLVRKK